MKLISIKTLTVGTRDVLRRFPFEVLFALIGCIAATSKVELNNLSLHTESWCWRMIMTANLGFLLSLSATLFSESKRLAKGQKLGLRLAAAALAVVLMYAVNPYERSADVIRFFLISLAFHLLVSFAAFTGRGAVQGFWQFNKNLFLRFLTSVLYSVVLYAGLSAAIAALNFLFGFKFEWDTFSVLWIWIAGLFNTLFFLAGVPASYGEPDADEAYPKGLKIFTQFVLIPLATVYVLILLAYEVKILLQWSLPKGLVSSLILGYAVFGILALLLVYPIREQQDNKWIKTYARSFYFLLLPLLVLLFLAVGARVFKYGITEYRYFLIVLAFWLLFISLYFLLSQRQNIKLIPVTLCVLTLLTIYGPQSAFYTATFSQRQILEKIMIKNSAYSNGLLLPVDSNKISDKDGERAVSTLAFLIKHDDLTTLQPYFKQDLQQVSDSLSKLKSKWRETMDMSRYELLDVKINWAKQQLHLNKFLGLEWTTPLSDTTVAIESSWSLRVQNSEVTQVSGYDYEFALNYNTIKPDTVQNDTTFYTLRQGNVSQISTPDNACIITIGKQYATFKPQLILDSLINQDEVLKKYPHDKKNGTPNVYEIPSEMLTNVQAVGKHKVAFRLTNINFERDEKTHRNRINYLNGIFLIKW
ncbi:DUF4153 domain-containing protein [Mucilaginibacter sp. Bleaf8]|uniref:DUF4153 domain-containing protein n=1 Tax=Mucilaginibacter sp. Bleaf8 TaxID=2834430 RepID=UPI001BCC7319|nr:DUF4153 domain-containing protein [Mucilaginibacter sp. Bleaf8]MBS7565835.1 DUF4153 domain-containing protein [Mucilaginibacter sp. Bleaf8]